MKGEFIQGGFFLEPLVGQVYAFTATVVIGAVAGFCFDYYRVLREIYRPKKVGTYLGDSIFWLITTILVFGMLLMGNWGEMRLYVLIGLSWGVLVYFYFLSAALRRLIRLKFFLFYKIWYLIIQTGLFIWLVVSFPLRLVLLVLSYPAGWLKSLLTKARLKLGLVFFKPVGGGLNRLATKLKSKMAGLQFWKRK